MPDKNKKSLKHRVPFYRRPIVVVSCLAAIVLIALLVVLIVKMVSSNTERENQPTEETENALVYSEDGDKDEENDLPPEDQKVIMQYEGENPNELDHLTGLITYTEVKDGTLVAMVSIDQYLGNGTCVANLKNDGGIAASAEQAIEADASTSHCGPITVNLAGASGGKYQLEVVISSGGKTGTITSNVEF